MTTKAAATHGITNGSSEIGQGNRPNVADAPGDNTLIRKVIRRFSQSVHEIELRQDLSREQKVDRIRHIACGACAAIAVQPIPFADIFVLTPVQAYFGSRIAAIHGVPVSDSQAQDLMKEIIGLMGLAVVAQQIGIGVWKLITGGAGGFVTVPLVYSLTYAVMTVADAYFEAKAKKVTLSKERMRDILRDALKKGKAEQRDPGGAA